MDPNSSHLYHESFVTEKGRIVVWKSADYLQNMNGSGKKKELERQEVIRMLNTLGYSLTDLCYKDSGQPMLAANSKEYISISHSHGWFAIYLASEPIGIDIEIERAKIVEGKDWFINEAELPKYLTQHELQLMWGAKEAYYKKLEGQIEDLRKEVTLKQIEASTLLVEHQNKQAQLCYRLLGDVYLVWTV